MAYPKPIQRMCELFASLPGIGPRQAVRLAFALLEKDRYFQQAFAEAITLAGSTVTRCQSCGRTIDLPPEHAETLCGMCSSPERNTAKILVVEKEIDMEAFEEHASYDGLYHILGGLVKPLEKNPTAGLRLRELFERVQKYPSRQSVEVIVAVANTAEGNHTGNYIDRILQPLQIKTTRLGQGLSTGAEIEYADSRTLEAALKNRK